MNEFVRLSGAIEWIELWFVERKGPSEQTIEVCIRHHLADLSLSNTKQSLYSLDVKRSRTAIHDWVRKANLQPTSTGALNQIAVDETVIRTNDERHWLYAAVDPDTNKSPPHQAILDGTTQLTVLFLRELREKQQVKQATFLVDGAHYLKAALERLGLRFQITRHGNRNSAERVFREVSPEPLIFVYVQQHEAADGRIVAPSLRRLVESILNVTRYRPATVAWFGSQ